MANIIQIKRSTVAGKVPNIGDLQVGEIAINLADRVIYTKDPTANVFVIGSGYTTNVIEGDNLYFTNARAIAALTGGSGIVIDSNGLITSNATSGTSLSAVAMQTRFEYTASAGQTSFSGNDDNANSLLINNPSQVEVFLNGVRLVNASDYTANTSHIVLSQAADLNDHLSVLNIVDHYPSFVADSFSGDGSTNQFTLTRNPPNKQSIFVTLDGIKQHTTEYDVSGYTLTFNTAPYNTANVEVIHLGGRDAANTVSFVNGMTGNVILYTANITEDTNLYYTNARVYANVEQIGYSYNTYVNARVDTKANIGDLTTSNVAEGTNLYYTNARVQSHLESITGNVIPDTDNLYSLGSLTNRFADLYLAGNSLYIGNVILKEEQSGLKIIDANTNNVVFTASDTSGVLSVGGAVGEISNSQLVDFVVDAAISTSNVIEGSNLYFTNTRAVGALTAGQNLIINSNGLITVNVSSTDDIPEGSANLYYTDVRVDGRVSPAYNQANTATTYATSAFAQANTATTYATSAFDQANTATTYATSAFAQANTATTYATSAYNEANTRVQTVAGVTSTVISNQQIVASITNSSPQFQDLTVQGNLIVTGNITYLNVEALEVDDNMIYLNANSTIANPDLGWSGNYNDGIYRHAGMFRDATDGVFKFFDQYEPEPDASAFIDTSNATFHLANVQATTFIGNLTGTVSTLSNHSTDNLTEGSTNLYFTTARVSPIFEQANTAYIAATSAFASSNTKVATVAGVTSTTISNAALLAGLLTVDGSGSGLDADLLDGQSSAYYATASSLSSYLPLSGGTVTGTLLTTPASVALQSLNDGVIGFGDPNHTSGWGVAQGLAARSGDVIWALGSTGSTGGNDTLYLGIGSISGSSFSTALSFTQNRNATFQVDARAPIFYDSNDTNFYLNPASTSNFVSLNLDYSDSAAANFSWGLKLAGGLAGMSSHNFNPYGSGSYRSLNFFATGWNGSSVVTRNVMSLGSYNGHAAIGTDPDDNYRLTVSGTTYSSSDVRSPIFYDSSNTAYYTDPNSISSMYGIAIRGDASSSDSSNQIFFWGNGNTTTSAIGFKANAGGFPNPTGNGDGYNTYLTMDTSGRGWVFRLSNDGTFGNISTSGWILNNGIWQAQGSMRAPIFYDSNDTGYYVDPRSTSVFNTATGSFGYNITSPGGRNEDTGRGTYGQLSHFSTYTYSKSHGLTYPYHLQVTNGGQGFEIACDWINTGSTPLRVRSLRDCCQNWSSWTVIATSGESFTNNVDLRAPIFYDSNDTTYYVNPNDTGTSVRVAGNVTAYYSDERLKTILGPIDDPLDKLKNITGFYYEENETAEALGYKKRKQVGVSAQKVQEVLPEIVTDAPINAKYLTIDYAKLTPLLIEAIKEQQKTIDMLTLRLNLLETKLLK